MTTMLSHWSVWFLFSSTSKKKFKNVWASINMCINIHIHCTMHYMYTCKYCILTTSRGLNHYMSLCLKYFPVAHENKNYHTIYIHTIPYREGNKARRLQVYIVFTCLWSVLINSAYIHYDPLKLMFLYNFMSLFHIKCYYFAYPHELWLMKYIIMKLWTMKEWIIHISLKLWYIFYLL